MYDICLNSDHDPTMVIDNEIQNAVNSLNRGKATDVYGVTAEHVYYGGQEPPALKLGILNPIFKKKKKKKKKKGNFPLFWQGLLKLFWSRESNLLC